MLNAPVHHKTTACIKPPHWGRQRVTGDPQLRRNPLLICIIELVKPWLDSIQVQAKGRPRQWTFLVVGRTLAFRHG
jgi:hypothetical protein